MALTPDIIENATPREKIYKLYDKLGLYLEVSPRGRKWWRFRYRFKGRETRISLGVYPEVQLMEAREQRDECRSLLEEGVDPSDHVYRATSRREDESRRTASRFYIDEEGALSIRMGRRRLILTPKDTADLRIFLDATRSLTGGQGPCR